MLDAIDEYLAAFAIYQSSRIDRVEITGRVSSAERN
jgi:hypothetical protein